MRSCLFTIILIWQIVNKQDLIRISRFNNWCKISGFPIPSGFRDFEKWQDLMLQIFSNRTNSKQEKIRIPYRPQKGFSSIVSPFDPLFEPVSQETRTLMSPICWRTYPSMEHTNYFHYIHIMDDYIFGRKLIHMNQFHKLLRVQAHFGLHTHSSGSLCVISVEM